MITFPRYPVYCSRCTVGIGGGPGEERVKFSKKINYLRINADRKRT